MARKMKKPLALFLALVMCLGMVNFTAFAEETGHTHNADGWTCTQAEPVKTLNCEEEEHKHTDECYTPGDPVLTCEDESEEHEHDPEDCYVPGEPVLTCEKTEHTHGDECYTVTEGEWTCVNAVGNFLDAVAAIPADINADNAAEAGELVNAAFDAYEVLVDAGLDEYDGVADALSQVEAAYVAIDKALEMESSNYASGTWYDGAPLLGFGAAIGFDPRDTTEFPKSDNTQISVIPWDFHNEKHAKDYYYYYDYRIGGKRTDPAPDPVQSSYFEKTYSWTDLNYYDPIEVSKSAPIGGTGRFGWRQGVTNFNDPASGLVPTIPSVYLYRLEEITGEEYIDGGRNAIEFHASTEPQLESSGGPVYQPTGPYARIDVPIAENAPKGAKIQVRFRMAMGYDMEWQPSEGTYNWYVQDFILNLTVGEGGTTQPTVPEDADVTHHLYMPAGTSTTFETYVPYPQGGSYTISEQKILGNGDADVATAGTLRIVNWPGYTSNRNGEVLQVPITAADGAEKGATTTITLQQKWNRGDYTCVEAIVVHIIDPREQPLDVNKSVTMPTLGSGSGFEKIQSAVSNNTSAVTVGASSSNGYTATRKAAGDVSVEYQYRYVTSVYSGQSAGYYGRINYRQQTVYVDVTNFTVPNDDPDTIDGLNIKKEASATSVVDGDTLIYTLTVTNTSSVDKTVTVTDLLPNGVDFNRFDPADDQASYDASTWTVTWMPTVPAGGNAVLKIVCDVNVTRPGSINNTAKLTSGDGNTDEATTSTPATPKPTTYTVRWMGVDQEQGADPNNKDQWSELHKEDNVTADSEPVWATVKEKNNLTDPKSYTLNGKTYTWNGQWTEEWNAAKTVKTFWAVYVEQGGEGPGPSTDPKDFNIKVEKRITSGTTGIKNGSQVTYEVKVTNNTEKNLPLYDLVIWDVMDPGLTMNLENGQPKDATFTVENNGENTNIQYKGSAQMAVEGKTKTAYYWQLTGEFKKGATVTLTYTDTVSNTGHDKITLYNIAYATGYTTATENSTKMAKVKARGMMLLAANDDTFDPNDLFDPDRKGQQVSGSSGAGTGVGGSGGTSIEVEGNPYTVTFVPHGGNWNGSTDNTTVDVPKAESDNTTVGEANMPDDPTREKYDFAGWNTKQDGSGDSFTKDTPITDDVTVYAQWTPKAPTDLSAILGNAFVTVDCTNSTWSHENKTYGVLAGGVALANAANSDGTWTVTVTNTPYVAEYNKSLSGHTASTETKSITLTWDAANGKWTPNPAGVTFTVTCPDPAPKYTVTYEWNAPAEVTVPGTAVLPAGGSYEEGTSVTVAAVPEVSVTVGEATYKLVGWTTEDATITGGSFAMPAKAVVLKGQWQKSIPWTPIKPLHTVIYKDGDSVLKTEQVVDGTEITIEAAPTAPAGKEFDGWKGSDGKDYKPGDKITVTGDLTLTAQWKDKTYTVTFDANNGILAEGTENPATVKHGELATQPADPIRSNHRFDGWYLGNEAYDFTTPVTGNIELVAQWTYVPPYVPTPDYTYTLNYSANGGVGAPASQSQTNDRLFTVSTVAPTRENYNFAGWALSAEAETAAYQAGDQVRINNGTSLTLFAVWTAAEENVDETQTPTTETPETPAPTETPDEGEDLGDNDTPLTDLPEPTETQEPEPEETPEPDESEELGDNDTPLADVPQTGDSIGLWIVLALCSAAGLYCFFPKKKDEQTRR